MTVFHLPDLGEGLRDAEIITWHVAEGDHVIAEQPLVSVETDKAVVEIPAPVSGTVTSLIAQIGDVVPTGGALAEITTEAAEDTGAIVGELERRDAPTRRGAMAEPAEKTEHRSTRATPAVRQLARDRGVDLEQITGSGPGGAILSSDVVAASSPFEGGEALRGVRRVMARTMTKAHAAVVPATIMDDVDIGAWAPDEDPTLRLIRAICAGCRTEPALNAWFDGERRRMHDHVDLTIAMDTADGLFTPVLKAVDSEPNVAARLAALKAGVENRTISPQALKGGTITLSNFGMLGGEHAVLVVAPPQVAILGGGRISEVAAMRDGHVIARPTLPLSLTFDHRVVTGGEAARFLAAVRADLERPTAETHEGTG